MTDYRTLYAIMAAYVTCPIYMAAPDAWLVYVVCACTWSRN